MPTFKYESVAASSGGTFLFQVPDVSWFCDSVLTAIAEMTIPDNWFGDSDAYRTYAVNQAAEMLATYQLLNFNPFPVGLVLPFSGDTPPDGYLLCDGSDYLTIDYPKLFTVIGYKYGGSSSLFNVPDLRSRVPIGTSSSFPDATSGGEESVTLSTSEIPSHSHADIGHTHSIPLVVGLPAQAGVGFSANQTVPIITDSTGLGFANIQNTGGGGSHNNMQPYLAINYIIYAGE